MGPSRSRQDAMWSYLLTLLLIAIGAQMGRAEEEEIGPWKVFQTHPKFKSLFINISTNATPKELAPGYFFITPYISDFKEGSFGPQIYDNEGNLVWWGNDTVLERAMDTHVCDYVGGRGDHICFNDALPSEQGGHSTGAIRFFDQTYTEVATHYTEEGDLRAPDIHELNVPVHTDGSILLQDVYQPRPMDLTAYNGSVDDVVLDGCFQEVDLLTKNVNFEWCALDHVQLDDTYTYLWAVQDMNYTMAVAGNGTALEPWDFFHINSVAKNEEGDYLVSARHFNTLFKIAGNRNTMGKNAGEILWRMGGKRSDCELQGFNMSRQHTARFLKTTAHETVISVFDNGYDGEISTANNSFGRILSLNNDTMVATQLREYPNPSEGLSASQGSMQVLDGGNVVIGWGNRHFYTEFAENGTVLLHAQYNGGVESFRIWKYPWVGRPLTKPDLLPYAYNISGTPLCAYVSWNGATEVRNWRFHVSYNGVHGPWHLAGTFAKTGFETFVNFSEQASSGFLGFAPYVRVQALDINDHILDISPPVKTFIPNLSIIDQCNETMCDIGNFTYPDDLSSASDYKSSNIPGWITIGIFMFTLELFAVTMALCGWDILHKLAEHWESRSHHQINDRKHVVGSSSDSEQPGEVALGAIVYAHDIEKMRMVGGTKLKTQHKRSSSVTTGFSLGFAAPTSFGNRWGEEQEMQQQKQQHRDKGQEDSQQIPVKHRQNRSSLAQEIPYIPSPPSSLPATSIAGNPSPNSHPESHRYLEIQRMKLNASPLPEHSEPDTSQPGGSSHKATSRH